MRKRSFGLLGAALYLAAPLALAHHSGAMFDRSRIVTLNGTIRAYEFANPHCWIRMMVADTSGTYAEWDIEGAAPYRMSTWGFTPQALQSGAKVSLRMHPLKDGRKGGILIDVTYPNGKVIGTPNGQ